MAMSLGKKEIAKIRRELRLKREKQELEYRHSIASMLAALLVEMTQTQLAEKLECHQPNISKYLHCEATPSKVITARIIALFQNLKQRGAA